MLKLILISILCISCILSADDSIKLFFGLKSHMSIKKVENIIEHKMGSWKIVEDTNISDKRPKYRFTKIKTTIFQYKGLKGVTFLEFFNDQLMAVVFYPKDRQYNSLINDRENSNAVIGKDIEGNLYLKWFDKKLEKKFRYWLYKYS